MAGYMGTREMSCITMRSHRLCLQSSGWTDQQPHLCGAALPVCRFSHLIRV